MSDIPITWKEISLDFQKLEDMLTIEAKCEKCETINTITLEEGKLNQLHG
jgi:phage FluMu protein Com